MSGTQQQTPATGHPGWYLAPPSPGCGTPTSITPRCTDPYCGACQTQLPSFRKVKKHV